MSLELVALLNELRAELVELVAGERLREIFYGLQSLLVRHRSAARTGDHHDSEDLSEEGHDELFKGWERAWQGLVRCAEVTQLR